MHPGMHHFLEYLPRTTDRADGGDDFCAMAEFFHGPVLSFGCLVRLALGILLLQVLSISFYHTQASVEQVWRSALQVRCQTRSCSGPQDQDTENPERRYAERTQLAQQATHQQEPPNVSRQLGNLFEKLTIRSGR
jgi:hypothetical protein